MESIVDRRSISWQNLRVSDLEATSPLPLPDALQRMAVRDPSAAQSLADDFGKLTLAAEALAWAHEQLPSLLSAMDLPSLLETVLQIAKEFADVDGGFLVVWNPHPDRGSVSYAAMVRDEPETSGDLWIPNPHNIGSSLLGHAVRSGRPTFSDDASKDSRFSDLFRDDAALSSVAVLPVGQQGALCLYDSERPGRFARSVRLRLSALAAVTGCVLGAYTETGLSETPAVAQLPGLVGGSPPMRELRAAITAFAGLDWPVLFVGEPGTGKAAAAKSTHVLSNRRDAPYVTFTCSQHHPDRVEALLFGEQQPGSTTDGALSKVGDGTLFLEDVETLPNSVQLALVKLMRDGTYQRLGGADRYRFRGRILSSSHSAEEMPPTLRDDLYFRLSACIARSPSLAMRPEDIPEIALHLLQTDEATTHLRITPAAAAQLRGTEWPNNLNDLQRVLSQAAERAIAKATDEIDSLYLLDEGAVQVDAARLAVSNIDPTLDLKSATDAFQRARVEASLTATNGNVSAAARQLGVTRQWLHRLITRWTKR